jgi:NAD+ kinase
MRKLNAKPKQFRTAAIIGKYHAQGIAEPLFALADFLARRGMTVIFEADTAETIGASNYQAMTPEQLGKVADVAIVVGGDGTMLGIARQLAPFDVPLVGINQGRLGFMTDIPLAAQFDALAAILDGQYVRESRTLLEARVERPSDAGKSKSRSKVAKARANKPLFEAIAFNDVVVTRGEVSGMIELTVEVNGEYTYTQRADGLIIATPTGSTAYALSAHGPILHPALAGLVLVPVAPQALSNRPIVLPDSAEVVITLNRLSSGAPNPASASFDMQTLTTLREGDRIIVRLSPHRISFLHPVGYSYFGVLRQKLNWTLMPVGSLSGANSGPYTSSPGSYPGTPLI